MKRILERHDDVGTVGFMIYAGDDGKFYADAECKVQLTVEDLGNAFVKGCVINQGSVMYKPSSLNADGSLSYGGGGGQKLYNHGFHIGGSAWLTMFSGDIYLNIISTNPNLFIGEYNIDGDPQDEGEIYNPLSNADFAFISEGLIISVNGEYFGIDDGNSYPVYAIKFNGEYFTLYSDEYTECEVYPSDIEYIYESVSEVI